MEVTQALLRLRPGAQWTIPFGSNNADDIIWLDDSNPVSQEELDNMMSQPVPVLTPEEKLEQSGLTVADLKSLLGLEVTQ